MEKKYERYAAQIKFIISSYERSVKEAADAATKLMGNNRFSPIGKEEGKKEIFADLNKTAANNTSLIRETVKAFCNEYRVKLPEDGKNHDTDIANAIQVIDMLGFLMTENALRGILDPIKNSYKSLKMIYDIMEAKNGGSYSNTAPDTHYSDSVMRVLYEYMGINTQVNDYLDSLRMIEDIVSDGVKLGFRVESYSDANVVVLIPVIPYSILACADWMIQTGEQYAALEDQFTDLFKVHTPTAAEMIESILK